MAFFIQEKIKIMKRPGGLIASFLVGREIIEVITSTKKIVTNFISSLMQS
jgi:hypothetical protein